MKTKRMSATVIALSLMLALFTGCAGITTAPNETGGSLSDSGIIFLKVNPEISVHYDKDGLVTKLQGMNDDGTVIVSGYNDFVGRDARVVVKDLVDSINNAGFFVSEIDGSYRSITIEIESGSFLPDKDFINVLAGDVQTAVQSLDINAERYAAGGSGYSTRVSNIQYTVDKNNQQNGRGNTVRLVPNHPSANGDSGYGDSNYGDSRYADSNYGTTINIGGDSGYGDSSYGDSNYSSSGNDSGYGNTNYNDSNYGDSNYSNSGYGNS